MGTLHKCCKNGFLVSALQEIPSDLNRYCTDAARPTGCNRIFCKLCQSFVRQWKGVRLAKVPYGQAEHSQLYETPNPTHSIYLTTAHSGHLFRVYSCRCFCTEIASPVDLEKSFIEFDDWGCHGHNPSS